MSLNFIASNLKLTALSVLAFVSTATAHANDMIDMTQSPSCQLQIHNIQGHSPHNYNPLSRRDYVDQLSIRIKNVGTHLCMGVLEFDQGQGPPELTNGSNSLDYLILSQNNHNQILYDTQRVRSQRMGIELQPGGVKTLQPRLFIPRAQAGTSGTYTSILDLVFRQSGQLNDRRTPFTLRTKLRASVQANFTGVDRSYGGGKIGLVKLGEMTPGQRRRLGLQLRSNTDVNVSIKSRNGGELFHNSLPGASIGYGLHIDGQIIDLTSKDDITLTTDVDPNGLTSPIEIELDNFTNAPAGHYNDVIQI